MWWRVGPALAAAGHRVVAVDQAGHGRTGHWQGHHRFRDNAADVVAFARAIGLGSDALRVIGHSWGGLTAAALPVAGLRPARLVLLDPPVVPHAIIAEYGMTELSSQLYEDGSFSKSPARDRRLWVPGWVRASVVDPTTLEVVADGEPGILRIDDLANIDSVAAVQTSDLAIAVDGGVRLIGRAPGAILRGCSLSIEEALGE